METRLVYITTSNADEARRIGRELVAERLAACVNILDGMTSMYWWEGEVQDDQECVLLAKTRADLADDLVERVKKIHSYDVPCVVCLPIREGNPDFLAWIGAETGKQSRKLS
jgi:periplasmic divalent cation tolerance protein